MCVVLFCISCVALLVEFSINVCMPKITCGFSYQEDLIGQL